MTHQNTPGYLSLYVGPGQPADLSSGADLSDADLDSRGRHDPGQPEPDAGAAANECESIAEDDPYDRPITISPDWSLQVAERVWEYLLGQKTHPSVRDIRSTIRTYLTLATGVAHPFGYSSEHWTARAATEIQVMELRHGSTVDRIQQTLLDYKRIADGEVDDPPDPDAEVDDWAARAATELMYMIRQRVGDLSAEGIRLLIMDEYEDMNDDAADFDITAPIEHMDLESGAGTTVNIHAPVDVASFIMGPGSTINVFEPITEVAVEQENGGTVWFMATPNTSHVQQGPGGLHILATRPEGCAGCMGSDDCEGCDGIAEEDPC